MCAEWGISYGTTRRASAGEAMTQLGEAVAVTQFIDSDDECPFSHDPPPKKPYRNNLVGSGPILGKRMGKRKAIFLHEELAGYTQEAAMPDPRSVASHPFFRAKQPAITIDLKRRSTDGDLVSYPVTAAAHHLIPAQESLKESKILEYLIKKGENGKSAEVKTGKSKHASPLPGKCWSNIGFDVNGSQNGTWLPGAYAVNDGRWLPLHLVDEEEEDISSPTYTFSDSDTLDGLVAIDPARSRKWLYVREAVRLASAVAARGYGGQFHDRHEEYSSFVVEVLDVLHARLSLKEKSNLGDQKCEECRKRSDEYKKAGVPTPFSLLPRLCTVMARLEARLRGAIWYPGLYTSAWGNAYIGHLRRHGSD